MNGYNTDGDSMDDFFMEKAIEQAKKAYKMREIPIGAVVVKDGEVIGEGYNMVESTGNPLNHAEIIAIQNATDKMDNWRFYGCTLYVTLEPCVMCTGALIHSRMDRVVFGAFDHKRGCCGSYKNLLAEDGFNHKVEITPGVLEGECVSLLQDFFKSLRERKKNERIL